MILHRWEADTHDIRTDLIELIDTDNASVRQDHGPALQAKLSFTIPIRLGMYVCM